MRLGHIYDMESALTAVLEPEPDELEHQGQEYAKDEAELKEKSPQQQGLMKQGKKFGSKLGTFIGKPLTCIQFRAYLANSLTIDAINRLARACEVNLTQLHVPPFFSCKGPLPGNHALHW